MISDRAENGPVVEELESQDVFLETNKSSVICIDSGRPLDGSLPLPMYESGNQSSLLSGMRIQEDDSRATSPDYI